MGKLIEPLNKPLHWLGWIISAGAITVFLHFIGVHDLHTSQFLPNIKFGMLVLIIAIIDWIKHKFMLQ